MGHIGKFILLPNLREQLVGLQERDKKKPDIYKIQEDMEI